VSGAEDDVLAGCVSERVNPLRGLRRAIVGVDAHAAEVVTESLLEEVATGGTQRLAATFNTLDFRSLFCGDLAGWTTISFALNRFFLFFAIGAEALNCYFSVRHSHHVVSDAVRFLFVRIVDWSNHELRLHNRCSGQLFRVARLAAIRQSGRSAASTSPLNDAGEVRRRRPFLLKRGCFDSASHDR
jgi:hypothetical protein